MYQKHTILELVKNIINHRFILKNFIIRDLKERYKSSFLGFIWTVLHPLTMMFIYFFIFTYVFKVKIDRYPLFLLTGLIPWLFFSNTMMMASYSVTGNFRLMNMIYFPRELFPTSIVASNFIHFIFSFLGLFFLFYIYKIHITWHFLLLPLIIGIQIILNLALSLAVSALAVFLKDIQLLVNVGMPILFFFCPISYRTLDVPERFLPFFQLNPLVGILESYKDIILFGNISHVGSLFYSTIFSLCLLSIMYFYFTKVDYLFAERG